MTQTDQDMIDNLEKLAEEIPEPPEGADVGETMNMYIEFREFVAAGAKAFKKLQEAGDEAIKTYMVLNGIEKEKFVYEGLRLKITEGTNRFIQEKELRHQLMTILEADPDVIDYIIGESTKVTNYDYIDLRKVSKESKEED